MRAQARWLLAAVLLASPARAEEAPRIYEWINASDREALAAELFTRVAYLEVSVERDPDQPAMPARRDGFGAVIAPRRVAALSFVVEKAARVRVNGPKGHLDGAVILEDVERRVAIVETKEPLSKIGLFPSETVPAAGFERNATVFALVSTTGQAGVVNGVVTAPVADPGLDGHLKISMKLAYGMPVFDTRARLVGYARAVAWDAFKDLLVTTEMIEAARTATAAATRRATDPEPPTRPR